jgi:hypothetical protein
MEVSITVGGALKILSRTLILELELIGTFKGNFLVHVTFVGLGLSLGKTQGFKFCEAVIKRSEKDFGFDATVQSLEKKQKAI